MRSRLASTPTVSSQKQTRHASGAAIRKPDASASPNAHHSPRNATWRPFGSYMAPRPSGQQAPLAAFVGDPAGLAGILGQSAVLARFWHSKVVLRNWHSEWTRRTAVRCRKLVILSEAAKLGASFAASWEPLFRRGPVGNHSRLMGLGEAAVITYWPPPARESGIFCNRYRQSYKPEGSRPCHDVDST